MFHKYSVYVYVHIYMCIYVCICMYSFLNLKSDANLF